MTPISERSTETHETAAITWQTIANVACAVLFAVGAWVWSGTVQQVNDLQKAVAANQQKIAVLETQRDSDRQTIAEFKENFKQLNAKLDAALGVRASDASPTFSRGVHFDK